MCDVGPAFSVPAFVRKPCIQMQNGVAAAAVNEIRQWRCVASLSVDAWRNNSKTILITEQIAERVGDEGAPALAAGWLAGWQRAGLLAGLATDRALGK